MILDMTANDLEPDLVLTVGDAGGAADFSTVVSWRVIGVLYGVQIVNAAPASVVVAEGGGSAVLTYAWELGDTAAAGDMFVYAEALWPGNRPQTFPASGAVTVRFAPDPG